MLNRRISNKRISKETSEPFFRLVEVLFSRAFGSTNGGLETNHRHAPGVAGFHSAAYSASKHALLGLTKSTATEVQRALKGHQMVCSMSRKGNCWDNAVAESFFATLKRELEACDRGFDTRLQARSELFDYIEIFYNRQRRHSTLGYLSVTRRHSQCHLTRSGVTRRHSQCHLTRSDTLGDEQPTFGIRRRKTWG